jgi:peroxiredoxin
VIPGAVAGWNLYRLAKRAMQGARRPVSTPTSVLPRSLATISGEQIPVPDVAGLVHLQFRRFAGCPVCNLHLRSFVRRHHELRAANVREVVIFHSSAEELRAYADKLPFAVVPDPEKRLYAEFGVESSPRAVLDPRAWGAIVRGVSRSLIAVLGRKERLPPMQPHGGSLGLPADFLIAGDGRVMASKYGQHADDQWTVDELLSLARTASTRREVAP